MAILLVFLLLRLIFWLLTFPNPDEAYYWLWGQHPDWSYYDHPPFHAWVQGLFAAGLGRSPWVLRLPNLLSNGLFFYTYAKICRYLYGEQARTVFWQVVLLVVTSPLYFLFLALAWHDHWLITFALIGMHLFITFADGYQQHGKGESWRLYGAGGAIALALLCKYNAVFVVLGWLAAIVADKRLRPLLWDRRLYLAGAIATCGLAPILIWNWQNDWQSFHYYVNRSVNTGSTSLHWDACLGFIAFSLLMVSPFHCWRFFQVFKQPPPSISLRSTYPAVAYWMFIVSTAILSVISLLSAALYYWNITAYLLLFPLVAKADTQPSKIPHPAPAIHPPPLSSLLSPSTLYGLLFATLLVVHYSVFPISALVSKEGDPDSRMLYGWDQIGQVVQAKATELGGSQQVALFTTDYRSASALAYQLDRPQVLAISDRIDQFDFWQQRDADQLQGKQALILADDWHPLTPDILAHFEANLEPKTIPITRFGRWIKNYYLTVAFGYPNEAGKKSLIDHEPPG